MKRTFKVVLCVVAVLIAVPLAGIGFVVAYNQFDEPLTPQAQALVQPQPVGGDAASNAYFVLLGLRAPKGQDAHAAGMQIDKLHFDYFSTLPGARASAAPDDKALRASASVSAAWSAKLRCNWFEKDCLAHYLALRAELDQFREEHALLIERHQRVAQLSHYQDRPLLSLHEPLPSLKDYLDLDAFSMAQIVVMCEEGRIAPALEQLAASVATARKVLANAQQLVTKMVFSKMLRDNLALLNALLAKYSAVAAAPAIPPPTLLAPLSGAEKSIQAALDSEARVLARTVMYLDASDLGSLSDQTFEKLLARRSDFAFKRHATLNLIASGQPFYPAASRSPQPAGQATAPLKAWPSGNFWDDYVDNPTGKVLLKIAAPDYREYVDRLSDTDGYQRLTALHLLIRQGTVADAEVPALIEAQAGQYGDPYTGKPMQWDAASRTLSFLGHGKAPTSKAVKDYRFSVKLGTPKG
ncbi:MAG TPA: hypothetical protein VLJ57_23610 [Burkholderiaceae bacterium]|nr:hypothetical protein [Burkholderiaceae bacterium]